MKLNKKLFSRKHSSALILSWMVGALVSCSGAQPDPVQIQVAIPSTPQNLFASFHQRTSAPSQISEFNCIFANVMGSGIGDWTDNKTQVTSSNGCGYFGNISNLIPISNGGTVSVNASPGPARYVQILGAVTTKSCTGTPSATELADTSTFTGIYELGRTVTDIFLSSTIVVKNAYNSATATDTRCSNAGVNGDGAQPTPTPTPCASATTCTQLPCIYTVATTCAGAQGGDLGGIAGADSICNSYLPTNVVSAKALVGLTGVRDLTHDWPLANSTTYYRADGATIGATNGSGELGSTLSNTIVASSSASEMWTGLTANWATSAMSESANCLGWTSSAGYTEPPSSGTEITANVGTSASTQTANPGYTYEYIQFCNRTNLSIYCVSQ